MTSGRIGRGARLKRKSVVVSNIYLFLHIVHCISNKLLHCFMNVYREDWKLQSFVISSIRFLTYCILILINMFLCIIKHYYIT